MDCIKEYISIYSCFAGVNEWQMTSTDCPKQSNMDFKNCKVFVIKSMDSILNYTLMELTSEDMPRFRMQYVVEFILNEKGQQEWNTV